ncbi:hypothetical protein HNR12_000401 [Streptomonospora nanhaiensis]|uniref:Uncharacterized protein n=1 Tax=Streptomonospora nanhaiensis TaxID=1323731 RepID=A0A853BHB3_9ACTN|nr:hypothetical protein [Streptomonospora nanhaiensis]
MLSAGARPRCPSAASSWPAPLQRVPSPHRRAQARRLALPPWPRPSAALGAAVVARTAGAVADDRAAALRRSLAPHSHPGRPHRRSVTASATPGRVRRCESCRACPSFPAPSLLSPPRARRPSSRLCREFAAVTSGFAVSGQFRSVTSWCLMAIVLHSSRMGALPASAGGSGTPSWTNRKDRHRGPTRSSKPRADAPAPPGLTRADRASGRSPGRLPAGAAAPERPLGRPGRSPPKLPGRPFAPGGQPHRSAIGAAFGPALPRFHPPDPMATSPHPHIAPSPATVSGAAPGAADGGTPSGRRRPHPATALRAAGGPGPGGSPAPGNACARRARGAASAPTTLGPAAYTSLRPRAAGPRPSPPPNGGPPRYRPEGDRDPCPPPRAPDAP